MSEILVESDVKLIIAKIKTDIPAVLSAMSVQRADNVVTLEAPRSYFFYEKIRGYQTPAVLIIPDDIDFRLATKQANHINALIKMNLVALVEDTTEELLTLKAWRYQAALHEVLNQKEITSVDNKVKIIIKISRASFSSIYTDAGNKDDALQIYRKEAVLALEIEHYESY